MARKLKTILFFERREYVLWNLQKKNNRVASVRPCLVSKIFQDSPSHRILRHMHEALNIDENKN